MSQSRSNDHSPWPPQDHSDVRTSLQLEEEREAKRINDEIERRIELDKQEMKKHRPQAKLLLLGPAEAGKSTLLKNFQLQFAPKAFEAESPAWSAVIHLNLVRAVNFILEALSSPPSSRISSVSSRSQSSSSHSSSQSLRHGQLGVEATVKTLRMRLSPLRQVELLLHRRISGETPEPAGPLDNPMLSNSDPPDTSIRVRPGWKALSRVKRPTSAVQDELQDSRQILDACSEDIIALWNDTSIRSELSERGIGLTDYHVYFLNNAGRIASQKYQPLPEDILRARVQTIGVEEHRLVLEKEEVGQEWVFYDVEGRRGLKAWVPFFDDVNAMIFICPMAHFDIFTMTEPSTNCLLDTFNLWKQICENKLLTEASFVLFLNQMDLLRIKLESGVLFSKYVLLYKDLPNEANEVAQYFKRKFAAVHKHSSPKQRPLHIHLSCAIDTKLMATILARVQDVIFLSSLKNTAIL